MDLSKYPMPKALKNCSIENSIVEFHYNSPFHRFFIQDKIVESFKQRGVELQEYRMVNEGNEIADENNRTRPERKLSIFSNNVIKFLVDRQLISFNCVSSYPGWKEFSEFISFALSSIPQENLRFTEVRIRYISTYELPIFDKLDGKVFLSQFNDVNGAEIRFPVNNGTINGLVRVTNLLKSIDGSRSKSYVDVEVGTNTIEGTLEDAIKCCEKVHLEEKKNYFQLLTHDFVQELDPQ